MSDPALPTAPMRVGDFDQNEPCKFALTADPASCDAVASALGLSALRKLRFTGQIAPDGERDWRLTGALGATVVQPCIATLEPVTTRIDTRVERLFVAEMPEAKEEEGEVEMAGDETLEPLGSHIDPAQVMLEALALALPDYPRSESAGAVDLSVSAPGITPMSDAQARPFAGLASLRDKLNSRD